MSGGGGKSTNTIQQSDPWIGAQPALRDVLGQAQSLYQQGPAQYFPGQTYVSPTGAQQDAWRSAIGNAGQVFDGTNPLDYGSLARSTNSLISGQGVAGPGGYGGLGEDANAALAKALSGTPDFSGVQASIDAANQPILDNLNQNIIPGLNQRATFLNNGTGGIKALNRVLPQVTDQMSRNALAVTEQERVRALNAQQQGLNQYGQFANQQNQAALAGASLFPTVFGQSQIPSTLAAQYADWDFGNQQTALNDQINRFNFNQQAPWQALQNYAGIVSPIAGQGSVTNVSGTMPSNSGANTIGGAIAGYGLGAGLAGLGTGAAAGAGGAAAGAGMGAWGGPIGALAGGLLGYFLS